MNFSLFRLSHQNPTIIFSNIQIQEIIRVRASHLLGPSIANNFIVMDSGMLDIGKIPRLEFQVNNDELKNCIRELHFQSKTQDKTLAKLKKDLQLRPMEGSVVDAFTLIQSCIEIDPALLKLIATRSEPKSDESALKTAANKTGYRIGQVSDVLRMIFEKMKQLEKRVESSEVQSKASTAQRLLNLQAQLDEFRKTQSKQNRNLSDAVQLNLNSYEEKLREVQSKTLWQISDCQTKLSDRVNEQLVRDVVKESETRLLSKVKESLIRSNIDPQKIEQLEQRCLKYEKELEIKFIESEARLNQLRENVLQTLVTKKDFGQEKLDTEKKVGVLQVQVADVARKVRNVENDQKDSKEDIKRISGIQEESAKEIARLSKMVANLKLSDDFMKLMENLDPHKLCEIDTSLTNLGQRDLKIEKDLQATKRYVQKLRQKVQICNLLTPNDNSGKLDKDQINKLFIDMMSTHSTTKKLSSIEGQISELRSLSDMINEINKRIGKIQKEFDIQGVIYNIKALEEYIKKEMLIMGNRISQIQSMFQEEKRKRPLSASRKASQSKITSSVSFKKLVPVDCISCFQNPIAERTPERLAKRY